MNVDNLLLQSLLSQTIKPSLDKIIITTQYSYFSHFLVAEISKKLEFIDGLSITFVKRF